MMVLMIYFITHVLYRLRIVGAENLPLTGPGLLVPNHVSLADPYGCTELSPVVALNVPDIMDGEIIQVERKVAKIGRALPGVSVRTVDPDTFSPLPSGQPGLLLVKGSNVMKRRVDWFGGPAIRGHPGND